MKRRCAQFLAVWLVFGGTLLCTGTARAEPYCGVYAVYGAAKALGCADLPLETLVNEEFVTSGAGSSTADLVRAANLLGMDATPMSMLGVRSLESAERPLILHCSPRGLIGSYHHWMLYLGLNEDGSAMVVDGAGGVVPCSTNEVLARWDGVAIAVQDRERSRPTSFLSCELSAALLVVASAFLAVALIDKFVPSTVGVQNDLLKIALTVALAAFAGNIWVGESYPEVANSIDIAIGRKTVAEVGCQEFAELMQDDRVAVVDCRYEGDYKLGHIDGALNVPVDSGMGTFRKLISSLDRKQTVVIYCQSRGCGFSHHSAATFAASGFGRLAIFKPGYGGWVEYQRNRGG